VGAFTEQRKFTSYEYDTNTELNYAGARYYNATTGKFLSQDPIYLSLGKLDIQLNDPQSWNSYSYARNNPIVYVDQSGEFIVLAPMLIAAIPAIASVASFAATQPVFTGMIANAFLNHPVESSVRSTPIVGDMLDAREAITGKDSFSGVSLSLTDRAMSGITAVLPFVSAGIIKNSAKINNIERSSLSNNVQESLNHLESKNFDVNRPGVANGRIYKNKDNYLPYGNYKEYDVNSQNKSPNRDAERFVRNTDTGDIYYSNNHYGQIKNNEPAFSKIINNN